MVEVVQIQDQLVGRGSSNNNNNSNRRTVYRGRRRLTGATMGVSGKHGKMGLGMGTGMGLGIGSAVGSAMGSGSNFNSNFGSNFGGLQQPGSVFKLDDLLFDQPDNNSDGSLNARKQLLKKMKSRKRSRRGLWRSSAGGVSGQSSIVGSTGNGMDQAFNIASRHAARSRGGHGLNASNRASVSGR